MSNQSREDEALPSILRKRKTDGKNQNFPHHSSKKSRILRESNSFDRETSNEPLLNSDNLSSTSPNHFRGLANFKFHYDHPWKSPLPEISWADQKDLWQSMILKDKFYLRDENVLQQHPEIESRMRAILLDWLIEVCEVYKLHRETFYLAQDYIDRYLLSKNNLSRNNLQLLGTTALFVATKIEEIYPPKLENLAYVTDGACSQEEIKAYEWILVTGLNWNLAPLTINGWLNIFMQLAFLENSENFIAPEQYPQNIFIQICQVLDLCILDIESLKFSYSLLAASAIALFLSKEVAMTISGLTQSELLPCIKWMENYYMTAVEHGGAHLKYFAEICQDDLHNIQMHNINLKMLDQVHEKQRKEKLELSPTTLCGLLTPPLSSQKTNGHTSKVNFSNKN